MLMNRHLPLLTQMQLETYGIKHYIPPAPEPHLLRPRLLKEEGGLDIEQFHAQCCGGDSSGKTPGTNIQVHLLPDLFCFEDSNLRYENLIA